jgi:hypothetical protein
MYTVIHFYLSEKIADLSREMRNLLEELTSVAAAMPEPASILESSVSLTLSMSGEIDTHMKEVEEQLVRIQHATCHIQTASVRVEVDTMFEHEDWGDQPFYEIKLPSRLITLCSKLNIQFVISVCPPSDEVRNKK